MVREDTLAPRLRIPLTLLVIVVLALMAASERAASVVAGRLHLATASDVRAARAEARTAREDAAGVLGFENALGDLRVRQAYVETQMDELSTDYNERLHGPYPQALLEDLDTQVQDVQGRLAEIQERLDAACAQIRPRC